MGNFSRFCPEANMSKLVYVIAFDPGETTGWCVLGVHPSALDRLDRVPVPLQDRIVHCEYGQINCVTGDLNGFEDQMKRHAGIALGHENFGVTEMLKICERFQASAIVLEDFIIDMSKIDQARHTLSPVRITSAFSYGLWRDSLDQGWPIQPMFIQQRSLAKTTCTDVRLRNWGLYDSHSGRHSRDATRHAFYFLRSCRGTEGKQREKRHSAWPEFFSDPWERTDIVGDGKVIAKRKKSTGERVHFA